MILSTDYLGNREQYYRKIRYDVNVTLAEYGPKCLQALSEACCADMLRGRESHRREPGLADEGYTYFGHVFNRLLESRGYNQSTFAAECRKRGFKVGRSGKRRDIGQRSVSDWMHGKTACPREVPTYADAILGFSAEELNEFALAYAYWQTVSKEAFEGLPELRKSNRATPGEGNRRPTKKE